MLPPKLRAIKEDLENRKIYNVTGEEALLAELRLLEGLLVQIKGTSYRNLSESFGRGAMAVTSGPRDYCSCCGGKI